MAEHWYRAVAVEEGTFKDCDIDDEYEGGVVAEGFWDLTKDGQYVLIVRYEGEDPYNG